MTFSALLGLTLLLVLLALWLASWCWRLWQELKENLASAQRFRILWHHLPDVITEIDRDGRILDVNPLFDGFTLEGVAGKLLVDFLSHDQAVRFTQSLEAVARNHSPQSFDLTLRDPQGRISYIRNQLVPLNLYHDLQSLLVISTDVAG